MYAAVCYTCSQTIEQKDPVDPKASPSVEQARPEAGGLAGESLKTTLPLFRSHCHG